MSKGKEERDAFEVGYRRPPVAHRFRKGVSGNPAGSRRKKAGASRKAKNLRAEVMDELEQRVAVTENGRRKQIARKAAFAKQLVADALNGDPKARDQLIKLASQGETHETEANDSVGAAKDAEILERFRAEIMAKGKGE